MSEMKQLVEDTLSAIQKKNKHLLFGDVTIRATVFFLKVMDGMRTTDEAEVLENFEKSNVGSEQFKDLQTVFNGNDANTLYVMIFLLKLCSWHIRNQIYKQEFMAPFDVNAMKPFETNSIDTKTFDETTVVLIACFRKKIWNKHVDIFDLRFLSGSDSSHSQTVMGKDPKKDKKYPPFQTGFLAEQSLRYFNSDVISKVPLLTSQEKKKFKVRKEQGVLSCGLQEIKTGNYLYVVSPKGSLYIIPFHKQMNGGSTHHSTIRAGQPVLCAGELEIAKDEKTGHMEISKLSLYSGHYQPSATNLAFTALWLSEQKLIGNDCSLNGTGARSVKSLKKSKKFKAIRDDYDAAKSEVAIDKDNANNKKLKRFIDSL